MTTPSEYALREWEERLAAQMRLAKISVIGTLLALATIIALVAYITFALQNTKTVPYVVEVDKHGETRLAPSPARLGEWPVPVIRREVANYITYMRSISADRDYMLRDLQRLVLLTVPSSAALKKLNEINLAADAPLVQQQSQTNTVEIVSVTRISDQTWDACWEETRRNKSTGNIIDVKTFQGKFTLRSVTQPDPETLSQNPIGFAVLDFDIQEIRQ